MAHLWEHVNTSNSLQQRLLQAVDRPQGSGSPNSTSRLISHAAPTNIRGKLSDLPSHTHWACVTRI